MKKQLAWVAAVAICAFSLSPAAFAQGSLTPPGAPAPTMKTLDQIESRTPISAAPFTISTPGSYYLTTNLTVSSGDAITLAASGVTLDLNGFTIASTAASATGYGVYINDGLRNLTILNGFIQGGVTNDETGMYSGPGFGFGISGSDPVNARVAGVSVSGCSYWGIYLGLAGATVVESCTVRTVGGLGIVASIVKSSVAVDCGGTAIIGDEVADSRGESTGNGYGLAATTAQNCYGVSSSGYGLYAYYTALNCYGATDSGNYGLVTGTTAQNCFGYTGSGSHSTGLWADNALNCNGSTTNGAYGLFAERTAQNCTGYTKGSDAASIGLRANDAQNCYGYAETGGIGLRADVAIGCTGYSPSNFAIDAYIANSCASYGITLVTHKYNMP